jgi:hypothetical protein
MCVYIYYICVPILVYYSVLVYSGKMVLDTVGEQKSYTTICVYILLVYYSILVYI